MFSFDESEYIKASLYKNFLKIRCVNKYKWKRMNIEKDNSNLYNINLAFEVIGVFLFLWIWHQDLSKYSGTYNLIHTTRAIKYVEKICKCLEWKGVTELFDKRY